MNDKNFTNLRQRYAALFGVEPSKDGAIADLESSLGITLPDDVKAISQFYSGGIVGGISHNAFDGSGRAANIVKETLRLRAAIELPNRFIVLAEPSESLIVRDVESGVVTWCDHSDVPRLEDRSQMLGQPNVWTSYAEFFEFLLDEEDEERGA